ncbi:MAG: DUF805 domain-containing protein [Candidatus Izimaplasma sp.]|nr:DUF805 domain-containing protein [Candidatus Izimaplasma bacterium]
MENFFKEYVAMFKRWSDFEGNSNVREFWMAVLINFIISSILSLIGIDVVSYIYSLAILIPMIALSIRRLRDAGYSPWNLLWWFLPIIGWIILIIKWIKPSK